MSINKLKKFLTLSTHRKLSVKENTEASFRLMLDNLEVGRLSYKDGKWMYKYSDDFKESHNAEVYRP